MRLVGWICVFSSGCLSGLPELDDPCGAWPEAGLFRVKIDEPSSPVRKPYVYVPSTSEGPRDLVYLLHGAGATGPLMEEVTQFEKLADEAGFVLVYPNGLGWPTRTWNAGSVGFGSDADDVRFLDDLAADLDANLCGQRHFVTGFSNGAMMAHRWACEGQGLIDAIAPVSGTMLVDDCAPRSIPVKHYHGTNDAIVRPEGGVGNAIRGVSFTSVEQTMDVWREINACSSAPPVVTTTGDTTCTEWDCAAPTVQCSIEGWDHHWPGGIYAARTDANATGEIWNWFDQVVPVDAPPVAP